MSNFVRFNWNDDKLFVLYPVGDRLCIENNKKLNPFDQRWKWRNFVHLKWAIITCVYHRISFFFFFLSFSDDVRIKYTIIYCYTTYVCLCGNMSSRINTGNSIILLKWMLLRYQTTFFFTSFIIISTIAR